MSKALFSTYFYGADYNPDQWPEELWPEDMRLMRAAHMNLVTLPVFSWSQLELSDGVYDMDWLGRSLDLLHANGVKVCLATPTNAPPAWLTKQHPDIMAVDVDGRRFAPGERGRICSHSPAFKRKAAGITRELARRFGSHPAVALWHISNEYFHRCFCDKCTAAFQDWLRRRYGSLEELNRAWYANFWGHRIHAWDEVVAPTTRNEISALNGRAFSTWPACSLDYSRFMSDSILGLYLNEKEVVRQFDAEIPVTTNFLFINTFLDPYRWAPHLDVIAFDNYPSNGTHGSDMAFTFDLLRSLKGGQPFFLMEQSPAQVNWMQRCNLKRPGQVRLWSHQATARGADAACYFQFRASRGGVEKFHGAIVGHAGHENTRTFREVAQIGRDLATVGPRVLGSRVQARAAVIFDWDNWVNLKNSLWPSADLDYQALVKRYHRALWDLNIPVDVVSSQSDLSSYDLVLAPALHMVKPGVAGSLARFVERGGRLVSSFLSGIVDENDLVHLGGHPGPLRSLLGLWSEELDAPPLGTKNRLKVSVPADELHGEFSCEGICDLIHLEGAVALATYAEDFYAGRPALTEHRVGQGKAYYVACEAEDALLRALLRRCLRELGCSPALALPEGVELSVRGQGSQATYFLLNHTGTRVTVDLQPGTWRDLLSGSALPASLSMEAFAVVIMAPVQD